MAGDSGRDRKRPPARTWAPDDRQAQSVLRRFGRLAAGCLTGFVILSLLVTMLYRVAPPPVTPLMVLRSAEGYGIRKNWRPLDDISPALIRAVIASEDQRFCRHFGFDWSAIEMAWEQYQSGDGGLLGASTISMQTAKNVFLWPGRTWLRKAFEAYFTALIELLEQAADHRGLSQCRRMGSRDLWRRSRGRALLPQACATAERDRGRPARRGVARPARPLGKLSR